MNYELLQLKLADCFGFGCMPN